MAGLRANTSISSFLVRPNWSAWRVRACQVMPSTCIVYSFLPLVERVGGRFPPLHMVPAGNTWRELLRTPSRRSSVNPPVAPVPGAQPRSGHARESPQTVEEEPERAEPQSAMERLRLAHYAAGGSS